MKNWVFWKLTSSLEAVEVKKLGSFKELMQIIQSNNVIEFAVFRPNIYPDVTDRKNNYAVKHEYGNGSVSEILDTLWNIQLFTHAFVNGIRVEKKKIIIFVDMLTDSNGEIPVLQQFPIITDSSGLYWSDAFTNEFECTWTLGVSDPRNFSLSSDASRDIASAEILAKFINSEYHLSPQNKCIMLQSDLLLPKEWRLQHLNNRFIYCSINIDLRTANKILVYFMLLIVSTFYPKFNIIYLAFAYYENETLQFGFYSNGKEGIIGPYIDKFNMGQDDIAFLLASKVKKMVLSICPFFKSLDVSIFNTIPPNNFNFTDPYCRYKMHERRSERTI